MIYLANKDIIAAIINMFHMFNNVKENMNIMRRAMEDIKRNQIKLLLKIKNTISEIKFTVRLIAN